MGFSNKGRALKRMAAIPPAVKAALKAQNAANAADMVETARRFAPEDDGVLRDSIRHEDASDDSRISQRVEAGGPTTTNPVRQSAKATADYDYALAQEYGTADMPANPFFWPAWRLKRKAYKRRMSKAAKAAIGKAVRK